MIFGLKNILQNKFDYTLEVKEINSIEKIDSTSLYLDYLEDDYEKDEMVDEVEEEEEKDEREEEKKVEEHFYQEEENLNEENGMNKKENIIEMDIDSKDCNSMMNLDDLLEKFSVNNDNKRNNDLENLENYRQKEIERLKKNKDKKYKISKNYNGNETFLIRQKLKKGRVIDCAYLTGEQNDKIFIGFQMKCYFEDTNNLKKRAYDKDIIKNNLKQLLINSMYLLNCKISHWYYYLIFYINKEHVKYNVKDSIIQKYKGGIEILFYDPLEKIFYDCDKKILTELPKTENADLDIRKKCLEMYELNSKINNYSIQNKIEIKNSFVKDFEFTVENNEENMKTITDENQQFEVIYYDIEKKKNITVDNFNKDVDLSFGYIYILKTRNRTYNYISDKDPPSNDFPGKKKGKFY